MLPYGIESRGRQKDVKGGGFCWPCGCGLVAVVVNRMLTDSFYYS